MTGMTCSLIWVITLVLPRALLLPLLAQEGMAQQCMRNMNTASISNLGTMQVLNNVRQARNLIIRCSTCTTISSAGCLEGVTGEVMISASGIRIVELPVLRVVGLTFRVTNMQVVGTIRMPQLTQVGRGDSDRTIFQISQTSASSIQFNSLAIVLGPFILTENNAVQWISFPSLVNVVGDFVISQNNALTALTAPAGGTRSAFTRLLSTGALQLSDNPLLEDLAGFNSLGACTSISIARNNKLRRIVGFFSLSTTNSITITSNAILATVGGFIKVNFVAGNVSILENPRLGDIEFLNNVSFVEGSVRVEHCGVRNNLTGFARLTQVGGEFTILGNNLLPALGGTSLSQLQRVNGSLSMINNSIMSTVGGFNSLFCVDSSISVVDNPVLTTISGFRSLLGTSCTVNGNLSVAISRNGPLNSIGGFENVSQLQLLSIIDNGVYNRRALRQVSQGSPGLSGFRNLIHSSMGVYVSNNSHLSRISCMNNGIPDASLLSGPLVVQKNPLLLVTSGFNNFARVARIDIHDNAVLTRILGFAWLIETTTLKITENVRLAQIEGFARLIHISALVIANNSQLVSVHGLRALRRVTGTIRFEGNLRLNFSSLQNLECHDGVYANDPSRFCQGCPQWLITKPRCTSTESPTHNPSSSPTAQPSTGFPSQVPSTSVPSSIPTTGPTRNPTTPRPSVEPTSRPTRSPIPSIPTTAPTMSTPTSSPSRGPTAQPNNMPTTTPTATPTRNPTRAPSGSPSVPPSAAPTAYPTVPPSAMPTVPPTTGNPTSSPTQEPSAAPTASPAIVPTCELFLETPQADASDGDDNSASSVSICWPLVGILLVLLSLSMLANWFQRQTIKKLRSVKFGSISAWNESYGNPSFTRDSMVNPTYAAVASDNRADGAYATLESFHSTRTEKPYLDIAPDVNDNTKPTYMDVSAVPTYMDVSSVAAETQKAEYLDTVPLDNGASSTTGYAELPSLGMDDFEGFGISEAVDC